MNCVKMVTMVTGVWTTARGVNVTSVARRPAFVIVLLVNVRVTLELMVIGVLHVRLVLIETS